jgi:hypothetical protein
MMQLASAKRHLSYFSGLWTNRNDFSNELFWCRDFWYDTASAHLNVVLVNLCRVYDDHKRGINLLTFVRRVETIVKEAPRWLATGQIDRSQLSVDIRICEAKQGANDACLDRSIVLIHRLRKWRNKIVAHYEDQLAVFDHEHFRLSHPWELSDFEDLVLQGVVILDRYAFSRGRDIAYTEALSGDADRELAVKVLCCVSGGRRELRPTDETTIVSGQT